ncbi:unnamed protein product, partial [Hapterophycus canaliculatus]
KVICVESQVLKMQQDVADGADKGGNTVAAANNSSSSNGKKGGGGSSGGGGASLRSRSSRNSSGNGSGGGDDGGDGGGGGSGGGSGDRIAFEHEEIVPFEPWMADTKIAALGRLEGITLE